MEFMRIMMETVFPLLIALLLLTQVILPIFIPSLELFWLFKKGGAKKVVDDVHEEVAPEENLVRVDKQGIDAEVDNLTQEVKKDAEKLKSSASKVDEVVNKLKDAKDSSLNNLNNTQK